MGKIIGMTSGCFDLIHTGHIRYLERCKGLCDRLIVGVDSNLLVSSTKGPKRPIIDEKERLEMINGLDCVDSGFIVHELADFDRIVNQFGVHRVFKSERFRKSEYDPESPLCCRKVYGVTDTKAELVIVPDVPGLKSTTWIIKKILSTA